MNFNQTPKYYFSLLEQPYDLWNRRHLWSKALDKGKGEIYFKRGWHPSWTPPKVGELARGGASDIIGSLRGRAPKYI